MLSFIQLFPNSPCFAAVSQARPCVPLTWSSWLACLMGGSRSRNPPSPFGPLLQTKPSPSQGTDGRNQLGVCPQLLSDSCKQIRRVSVHTRYTCNGYTHCWFFWDVVCPGLGAVQFKVLASIPQTPSLTRCSTLSRPIP